MCFVFFLTFNMLLVFHGGGNSCRTVLGPNSEKFYELNFEVGQDLFNQAPSKYVIVGEKNTPKKWRKLN